MSKDESFTTRYTYLKANEKDPMSKPVDFIFLSFDRNLEGEECEQLAQEYFETHNKMTLPGEPLIVDLRARVSQTVIGSHAPIFHYLKQCRSTLPHRLPL